MLICFTFVFLIQSDIDTVPLSSWTEIYISNIYMRFHQYGACEHIYNGIAIWVS